MRIDVLTLFPEMFPGIINESILGRAQESGLVSVNVFDIRTWTHDKRRTVDDKPYGGGPGMVLKPEPIFEACDSLRRPDTHIVLLTPQGSRFDHHGAEQLSRRAHLLLICGHYEGFDERIRCLADEEISIGDYVLTGGEIPALAVIDATVRLLPGVLGEKDSLTDESFSEGVLEYPHYTRPPEYRGMSVPDILISGDHEKIKEWRRLQSLQRTRERRRDLWQQVMEKGSGDEPLPRTQRVIERTVRRRS